MTYTTILTSKGTTTIPKEIRDELGVEPGMVISFSKNAETNEFVIKRAPTIDEIRQANKLVLEELQTANKDYTSGMGYGLHITQKLSDDAQATDD